MPRPEMRGDPGRRELQLRVIARPTLSLFRPARANGAALLICPGGGYAFLAVENEGLNVARAFTALGYTVFLLAYRLPGEGWRDRADVPLQDAQRALRLIRSGAARFGIDPARAGVLGFSAVGHLAASLATGYGERVYPRVDAADGLSARPDFAGLLYAVTTPRLPATHAGTRAELLGPAPDAAAVDRRSPVLHVTAATPRSFVLAAYDDSVVPPSCTREWADVCAGAAVPVEARFVVKGGHGFGVRLPAGDPGAGWPDAFAC